MSTNAINDYVHTFRFDGVNMISVPGNEWVQKIKEVHAAGFTFFDHLVSDQEKTWIVLRNPESGELISLTSTMCPTIGDVFAGAIRCETEILPNQKLPAREQQWPGASGRFQPLTKRVP